MQKNELYFCVLAKNNQKLNKALAGVAQWTEHQPVNRRVAGVIPSQGTGLGCRPGPQLGSRKRRPHTDISLFLPPLLSKNK